MDNSGTKTAGWTILSDETVFDGAPYVSVRRQRIRTEQGREVPNYYKVELADYVICCPRTADGRIITLWQYKHGSGRYGLTFPAGIMEAGEEPEQAMRRELLEETGFAAQTAVPLGRYAVNGNQGCGWGHLFVLDGCRKVADPNAGDLEQMEIRVMEVDDVARAFQDGNVSILAHAAVWSLFRLSQCGG